MRPSPEAGPAPDDASTPAGELFGALDHEVWIVTSAVGRRRGGLVATFVNQASISSAAPRVLIGVGTRHHTHALIEDSGCLALHLIDEAGADLAARFARASGRDIDKLAGIDWTPGKTGAPILAPTIGWLEARTEAALDVGDRTIWVAEVVAAAVPRARPLTARRLFELLSDEDRAALRADFASDAALDAEAIRAWRARERA